MAGTGEPSSVLLIDRISLLRLQIHVKIYFMPFWQLELSFFSLTEQVLDCSIGLGVFLRLGDFCLAFYFSHQHLSVSAVPAVLTALGFSSQTSFIFRFAVESS